MPFELIHTPLNSMYPLFILLLSCRDVIVPKNILIMSDENSGRKNNIQWIYFNNELCLILFQSCLWRMHKSTIDALNPTKRKFIMANQLSRTICICDIKLITINKYRCSCSTTNIDHLLIRPRYNTSDVRHSYFEWDEAIWSCCAYTYETEYQSATNVLF